MIAQVGVTGACGPLTRQAFCHPHSACGERTVKAQPTSPGTADCGQRDRRDVARPAASGRVDAPVFLTADGNSRYPCVASICAGRTACPLSGPVMLPPVAGY